MSGNQGRVHCKALRNKTKDELTKQLEALKQELASLRVAQVTGGAPTKLAKIRIVRRSIGSVNIVIRQKTKANLKKFYEGKKYKPLDMRRKRTHQIRNGLTKHEKNIKTPRYIKQKRLHPMRKYALKA